MSVIKRKLLLIVLPLLLVTVGFILVYTPLNCWLFMQEDYFHLTENCTNLFLPFLLSWLPVLVWLLPRLRLLEYDGRRTLFGYFLAAAIAVAAPTAVAQEYIMTATGRLTTLQSINEFPRARATRYYKLASVYLDSTHVGMYRTLSLKGKGQSRLEFGIYIVLPVFAHSPDTAQKEVSYFLGQSYAKTISNSLSQPVKDSELEAFTAASLEDFRKEVFTPAGFIENLSRSQKLAAFEEAAKNTELVSYHDRVIFMPHQEPFEHRNGHTLAWAFITFFISVLIWFLLVLIPPFKDAGAQHLQSFWRKN